MNREIVWVGQIPLDINFLRDNKNAYQAIAWLAQGVLGTSTLVTDVTCIPTTPATLSVNITPGQIFAIENVDGSNYGSLPIDSHNILKQGLLVDAANLAITPPGTVGYSQNYLIQAAFTETDAGSTVLPYLNPSNPAVAWSGPNGSGTPNFTIRSDTLTVTAKAGVAATTGTQVTPSADVGYVGLFVVTVANAQATISSGNISQLASAPMLAPNGQLPLIPTGVQNSTWTAFADSGTADALIISPTPAPAAWVAGACWVVKKSAAANATTTPTLNVTGSAGTLLGVKTIVDRRGNALAIGDLPLSTELVLFYDGTTVRNLGVVAADVQGLVSILAGPTQRLTATLASAGTSVTFTADEIGVGVALGGAGKTLASYSQTLNTSTTGANGMDTGSPPTSGFLSVYAIYNPSTQTAAILGTTSAQTTIYTGAHMPSGYTMSALIAIWATNGSAQMVGANVIDREFYYVSIANALSSGTATSATSISLSSLVPAAARAAYCGLYGEETSSVTALSYAYFGPTSGGVQQAQVEANFLGGPNCYTAWLPLPISQTLYYESGKNTVQSTLSVNGYRI